MRAFAAVSKNRIPVFIQEDYPDLVNFLAAYYDWLQETFSADTDFTAIGNIDETREDFLKYYKDNHAKGLPDVIEADTKEVIKHIRELYKAKGTENAIKFLFKAVFNENVDISYPKAQILHPSDATWVRKRSIVIDPNGKDVSFFFNVEGIIPFGHLYIIGATQLPNGHFLLDISDVYGEPETTSTLTVKGEDFAIVKQVARVKINTPGTGFTVGQYLNLDNNVLVQVKEVTRGPITSVSVVSGGTGYSGLEQGQFIDLGPLGTAGGTGARATINQSGGVVTSVNLLSGGSYYAAPPTFICESTSGDDAVFEVSGNFSGLKAVDIISGGFDLPPTPWTQTISTANITVEYKNVVEHPGYFANQYGVLSSKNAYLEDEHYYQYFSYVIKAGVNTAQYEKVLRLFAHPAGMRFFGTLLLEELVSAGDLYLAASDFIVEINTSIDSAGSLEFSAWEIFLSEDASFGLPRYKIDLNKYSWLGESTYIDRFKDFTIFEWEANLINNPFYYESTNIQPDCAVKLLETVPSGTIGYGLDNWGETTYG